MKRIYNKLVNSKFTCSIELNVKYKFYKINELPQNNSEVQLKGKIISIRTLTQKNGKRLIAIFSDGKEQMELIW